jgi:predicted MFS family arabinose efflux permease
MNKCSCLTPRSILLLASLYVTQYVGFSFFSVAIIAIWRKSGMPLEQLGFFSLISLVWVIKFLWAPWVDRYVTRHQGNYSSFLKMVQFLLIGSIIFSSFFDVMEDKLIIIMALILVGLLAATQDIATEGLAFKLLTKSERGLGGTLKSSGGIIGNILGVGAALAIYEYFGWSVTVLLLAFITTITFIQLLLYKESKCVVEHTIHDISWKLFFQFWNKKGRVLLLILLILYPIGMCISYALLSPILVDIGYGLDKIGFINGVVGSILGIIASVISGYLLKIFSRKTMLIGISIFECLGFLTLLFLVNGYTNILFASLSMSIIFISYSASMPIIHALMMDQLSTKSPSTEYALQFFPFMLMGVLASAFGVSLSGTFGYSTMIIVASLFSFISMLYVLLFFKGIEYERD